MFAYIPHDMVMATETMHVEGFLTGDEIDAKTLQLYNDPFVFHDEQSIDELFHPFPLEKLKHVAADGLAELMSERINRFTAEEFQVWMRYHLKTCEKPSFWDTAITIFSLHEKTAVNLFCLNPYRNGCHQAVQPVPVRLPDRKS